MKTVVLTEASKDRGFGHLVRTDAISRMLTDCHRVVEGSGLPDFLKLSYDQIMNWKNIDSIKQLSHIYDVAIVDSYELSDDLIKYISECFILAVFIDDIQGVDPPNRSAVINYTPYAKEISYQCKKQLLGTDYVPLRSSILESQRRQRDKIESILVMIGGSDTKGITPDVVRLTREVYPKADIIAVANYLDSLDGATVIKNVGGKDIKELYDNADIAVTAAGSTLYEAAYCGVPTVALIVADNQILNARSFERNGCCISMHYSVISSKLQPALELLGDKVGEMNANSLHMISQNGAKNIADKIREWMSDDGFRDGFRHQTVKTIS